ncbi:MAG: glycosyltransferase family 4 protein, partial [Candidatus Aminicenantaceae bacterium]
VHVFHSPAHEEYFLQHENRSRLRNYLPVKSRLWIEKYCLKRATKIMVLSQFMKQKIVDIFHIPADRIIINPGGVDLNSFQPPEDRVFLKKKLNFPEGKIHLLTVRNLEPRMGLDNLLKCIHILKTNKTAIHLVMGGEGPERDNLQNLIQQYNLSNDVAMAGFIPSELLAQYYGAADFFILPTRKLEGFGLITPESLACGTPVLGTPVGGTKEILSNFDPEFLFRDSSPEAMAEGIQMAINNYFIQKKSYNDLRLRCRGYVEKNYSWQRHSDQLKVLLDEVITSRKDIVV